MTVFDFSAKHDLVNIENEKSEIFRVLEVFRLFDLLESQQLCLIAPKLWEDPYENFLKHIYGISTDEENVRISFEGYSRYIFGQCWTFNKETDATWRIYSPNADRVKIRTTVAKLRKYIRKIKDEGFYSYIGKVRYISEREIKKNINDGIKNPVNFHSEGLIIKYYLAKRKAFKYEKEVRLLVRLPSPPADYKNAVYQDPENLDVCYLPLDDPIEFIDEIVFDPRMPDSLVKAYTSFLRDNYKFNKNIYKSTIYTKPIIKDKVKSKYWFVGL